jgi:hypothetical protein
MQQHWMGLWEGGRVSSHVEGFWGDYACRSTRFWGRVNRVTAEAQCSALLSLLSVRVAPGLLLSWAARVCGLMHLLQPDVPSLTTICQQLTQLQPAPWPKNKHVDYII